MNKADLKIERMLLKAQLSAVENIIRASLSQAQIATLGLNLAAELDELNKKISELPDATN